VEERQVAVQANKIHEGEKEMSDDLYRSLVGRNKKIGKISAGSGFGSNVPGKKRKKKKKKKKYGGAAAAGARAGRATGK